MQTTEFFENILRETPIFADLSQVRINTLAGCCKNVHFTAGQSIFKESEPADQFYILRDGKVAIDIEEAGSGPITVQTLDAGDILGWSWLFPPYLWNFSARTMEDCRAISLDAKCLRNKCEADTDFGYELMKLFSSIMLSRLQTTRIQLLNVYGQNQSGTE